VICFLLYILSKQELHMPVLCLIFVSCAFIPLNFSHLWDQHFRKKCNKLSWYGNVLYCWFFYVSSSVCTFARLYSYCVAVKSPKIKNQAIIFIFADFFSNNSLWKQPDQNNKGGIFAPYFGTPWLPHILALNIWWALTSRFALPCMLAEILQVSVPHT